MSDSLQPHGLQHTRLLCSPLSPGVCSNSCPLSQWCYLTISSSVASFSFYHQSFPASGSFPYLSQFVASSGQNITASATALPMNIQDWFPLGLTGLIYLQSKGLSIESSPTPQFKSINPSVVSLPYGPTLTPVHDHRKNHSFHYMDLCQHTSTLE